MDKHGSLSMRPTPSRRKSSNLLASLARQNTLSEREKERQRQLFDDNNSGLPASSDAGNPLAGFGYAVPSRDVPPTPSTSSYAASYAALNTPSMVSMSSSYSTTSTAPTLHNTPTSSSSFGANLENLRSVVQKRMQTFSYIKRLHECRVHWCNTILLSREELEAAFDNTRMAKRSVRFAVLGMSTSMLLDITAAHDFLRALLSLLSDFDAAEDDENLKFKTKNLFKAGKGKRPSGTTDYALPLQDGDPSYVFAPNIPFDLDYSQVLFTLCDIMNELYGKIASFLGPSTGTSSLGTIGAFPQPQTASPLRHGLEPGSFAAGDRRAGVGLSPMLVEVVYKIDSKIKKIVTLLTKEIDQLARQSIKDQLDMVNRAFLSGKDDVAFPM